MTALDKELEQIQDAIVDDVESLISKYMSIVGWDVPEYNEKEAKERILNIMKEAINKVEKKN